MLRFSRTWWGQRFIAALEQFTDSARLGRGRSYASNGRILSYQIASGKVTAKVRGSINPYFGVYEEPLYTTKVTITPIARAEWTGVIADLSSNAAHVAKLLLNEMPDTIEDAFAGRGRPLLPRSRDDFSTSCSCPDYSNPCKHIAGVCYLLASALDQDPFLMFELRALPRDELRRELAKSPLGQVLASQFNAPEVPLEPAISYYPRPEREPAPASISLKEFWTGPRRLPAVEETVAAATVPALLIKKQGDYPPFWKKDLSFIAVMEEFYGRVRTKSRQLK